MKWLITAGCAAIVATLWFTLGLPAYQAQKWKPWTYSNQDPIVMEFDGFTVQIINLRMDRAESTSDQFVINYSFAMLKDHDVDIPRCVYYIDFVDVDGTPLGTASTSVSFMGMRKDVSGMVELKAVPKGSLSYNVTLETRAGKNGY